MFCAVRFEVETEVGAGHGGAYLWSQHSGSRGRAGGSFQSCKGLDI